MSSRQSTTDMAELSEAESDTSSIMGETSSIDSTMKPPSPASREQLAKRMESLIQENRVLMIELETYKLRVKNLQEENRALRQASVLIQAKAEQEEEFISNTLLKKIQELKKEKEALALNYEQEEECLTNDLSRKLLQLRQEKAELATSLQHEQESMVAKLLRKIKKLEADTSGKQLHLEQLRREKVELENTLEQEQEALVNRLWKRMDKLETEKQFLQQKLEHTVSAPPSPMDVSMMNNADSAASMMPTLDRNGASGDPLVLARDITRLRGEVLRLRQQLRHTQTEHCEKMAHFVREEQQVREENLRLQRKLQMEVERREQLCRHLSESESSLEMDDERHFNELTSTGHLPPARTRTISSPVSSHSSSQQQGARPASPSLTTGLSVNVPFGTSGTFNPLSPLSHRCGACGTLLPHNSQTQVLLATTSPLPSGLSIASVPATTIPLANAICRTKSCDKGEKFLRPANPPVSKSQSPSCATTNSASHGGSSSSCSSASNNDSSVSAGGRDDDSGIDKDFAVAGGDMQNNFSS